MAIKCILLCKVSKLQMKHSQMDSLDFMDFCDRWSKHNGFPSTEKKKKRERKVSTLQQLSDQRNSWPICHCGLTWNSGKYASDKIPASRYVPGLVWSAYLLLHISSGRLIFISHIYEQITPPCPYRLHEQRPARSHPSVSQNHSSGCRCLSQKNTCFAAPYSWNRVDNHYKYQLRFRFLWRSLWYDIYTALLDCSLFVF